MAVLFRCDRCKEMRREHWTEELQVPNPHGVRGRVDLCPDCLKAFWVWCDPLPGVAYPAPEAAGEEG